MLCRVAKPAKSCVARCGICSPGNKKRRPASRAAFSVSGKLEFPGRADAGDEGRILEACDATAAVRRLGLAEIGVQGFDFQDAVVRDGVLHAAARDPAGAPSRLVRGVAVKVAEETCCIGDFADGEAGRAKEQRAIGGVTEPAAERAHRGNLGLAEAAAAATAAEAMLRAAGKVDIRFAADDEMAAGEFIIISPIDTAHE